MALLIEKPWRTQPTGPVTVDWTNPISQGLVFARLGGTQTSVWPGNNVTRTGTRIRGSQFGLANGFGSTLGAGTTDSINTGYNVHLVNRTIFINTFVRGAGGSTVGRMLGKGSINEVFNYSSDRLAYFVDFSTSDGNWASATGSFNTGFIGTAAVTYNNSSSANVPILYINGLSVSITELTAPSGTAIVSTDPYYIGNRPANDRVWDGLIAETYIWNRILTPAEIFSIHSNPYQIFRPLELQLNSPPAPRIYYVAGPNSTWATPTSTEIINGQLSGGGAATASWSESAPLQTTTPFNFSQPASPLTTGTKYRAAAVQKAGDSNVVSNVVESDPFLAGAATLSNPEAVDITANSTKPKVDVAY